MPPNQPLVNHYNTYIVGTIRKPKTVNLHLRISLNNFFASFFEAIGLDITAARLTFSS